MNILMSLVLSQPGRSVPADANAIARYAVDGLSKKISKTMKNAKLDLATKAHLTDVKKRIDKALEAEYRVGGGEGEMAIERSTPTGQPVPILPQR